LGPFYFVGPDYLREIHVEEESDSHSQHSQRSCNDSSQPEPLVPFFNLDGFFSNLLHHIQTEGCRQLFFRHLPEQVFQYIRLFLVAVHI